MAPATVSILNKINAVILNPLIFLFFSIALLVFFYGIFKFIKNNNDDGERDEGKRAIAWGLVGMFIMISAFAIIRFILSSIGVNNPSYPFR